MGAPFALFAAAALALSARNRTAWNRPESLTYVAVVRVQGWILDGPRSLSISWPMPPVGQEMDIHYGGFSSMQVGASPARAGMAGGEAVNKGEDFDVNHDADANLLCGGGSTVRSIDAVYSL